MQGLKELTLIGRNQVRYNGHIIQLEEQDYNDVKENISLILTIITIRGEKKI